MKAARPALVASLAVAAVLLSAAAANAEPGPISLVSKSFSEQAEKATAPAISGNGAYVAFQATIDGLRGVFRKDLATGALETVAAGSAFAPEAGPVDARAPSISTDGRYVAFTTTYPLDPEDDLEAGTSDVYVADMATVPPTYELASARDGCDPLASDPHEACGLGYEAGAGESRVGSVASGRVALSSDGREVAFYTTARSDLTSGPGASTPGVQTPGGEVVLRDLATDRTTLVSGVRDPQTGLMETVGGADLPVPGGALMLPAGQPRGVSISGDGSTVAWLSTNLPAQVPLLADEREVIEREDSTESPYDEPLWRRVADGPEAPTRRIVGGGDPLAPGCPPGGTLAIAACRGPFPALDNTGTTSTVATGWIGLGSVAGAPQLSADGRTVALLGTPETAVDVFLVNMEPGLTRAQALRRLTRAPVINDATKVGLPPFVAVDGRILDLAISADGTRAAFTTARQQFPLSPPNLIGSPPAQLGLLELYLVDLRANTLQRLTHGVGGVGEPSLPGAGEAGLEAGANAPSLSADGSEIAFGSNAANLVAGDANANGDAFVLSDPRVVPGPGTTSISPAPSVSATRRPWRLSLSAHSLPDGSVRLIAVVPGSGAIRARAGTAGGTGKRGIRLALAKRRARAAGPVRLTLRAPARLRHQVHSREGLYATVRVSFRSPRHPRLHAEVQVRFRVHRAKRGGGR